MYVFTGRGNGDLVGPTLHTMVPGTWDVALGDLDEDGTLDVVTANETSSFSVRLSRCGGTFTGADTCPMILNDLPPELPDPKVALGDVCPGQPGHVAVIMGVAQARVFVTCSDGSGVFEGIMEPHGQQLATPEWDDVWRFVLLGGEQQIGGIVAAPQGGVAYAWVAKGVPKVAVLTPDSSRLNQNDDLALRYVVVYVGAPVDIAHSPYPSIGAPAGRLLYVGAEGLGALK